MSKKRLVVIDGKSVFYRGYYAMPNLSLKDGTPTGGVYGFAVMAVEVLKKMKPDYVAVAWDKPKTNIKRRRDIYPEYKANRKPAPPDFYEQVPILHDLLEAFGFPLYEIDDHEADDIMATFARQAHEKDIETILVTSDHDVLQLVSDDVTIAILRKGLTNVEYFNPETFTDKYQMSPKQFIDYKALRGDPSDNLPGVAGVGEKTAISLIADHESLDGVYEHIDEIKGAVQKKLKADKDNAYMTRELVVLEDKVPIEFEWDRADISATDPVVIAKKLRELEFRSLINQLPKDMAVDPKDMIDQDNPEFIANSPVTIISKKADLSKISLDSKTLMVHTFCAGAISTNLQAVLLGSRKQRTYAIDLAGEISGQDVAKKLHEVLHNPEVLKVGYDMKANMKAFLQLGIPFEKIGHDIRMAAFLVNSLIREQALTKLAQDELGYEGQNLDELDGPGVIEHAETIMSVLWDMYEAQQSQLKNNSKLQRLAKQIEWPVMEVLARMEVEGVGIDPDYLTKMSEELADQILEVEQKIYGHANRQFNISSPAQLAEVLFEHLELPTHGVKKGKTGYSTAANELAKLRDKHPIIDLITEYRELTKLKSTYLDTLPTMIDENNRLHSTFSMAVAPTGRLSSHDPNLQNIPVRTELGKKIRTAFVAKPGFKLISADYSQFELRLAASLSGDTEMIQTFNDGTDVHTRTAAQVLGKPVEDVTKEERSSAKVINFGILYGMSPHGLSEATGMSQSEAKKFIDRYFELRKPLLEFIDRTKEQARGDGYVETLFGRRRPTPDVKSSNYIVRQAAERAAINMPIQGTEADLMKMAMIEVDKHLEGEAKQILQVHDSILIEVPESKAEKYAKILKAVMEGIYKLDVNLDVDVSIGNNWGEL